MEPITTASAFATIVGLVSNFKAGRQASSDDEYMDFLEWLSEKRHDEIIQSINSNPSLSSAIEGLLNQSHQQVMEKLAALDNSLLELASRLQGFQQISHAIAPGTEMSEQALSILQQLEESGGSVFIELKFLGGSMFQVMDASAQLQIDEPRFVDDDLKKLCELGLLLSDQNKKGERLFRITRASVKYVQQVKKQS